MSLEVEMKAHVREDQLEEIKKRLTQIADFIGTVEKHDIYWATELDSELLFRTRLQILGDKKEVLFTRKPVKVLEETEINEEIEFRSNVEDWDEIQKFYLSLGYVVGLKKIKEGWEYLSEVNGIEIHIELMKVNNLGYFFEAEIIFKQRNDSYIKLCQKALFDLFEKLGLTQSIERKTYHKMIKDSLKQ